MKKLEQAIAYFEDAIKESDYGDSHTKGENTVNRITNLQILDEFGEYGLYWCKFKGTPRLFTTNHAVTKVLTHYTDHDALEVVRDDVAEELKEAIKAVKEAEKRRNSLDSDF